MQAALALVPAVISAGGKYIQGRAAKKAGEYNQRIAEMNARQTENEGAAAEVAQRSQARLALGRQIGAQAESGFMPGTGTALDSLLESATNAEMDALSIRREAASRALAMRLEGQAARKEGKSAFVGSLFGAASTLAGAGADYAASRR